MRDNDDDERGLCAAVTVYIDGRLNYVCAIAILKSYYIRCT